MALDLLSGGLLALIAGMILFVIIVAIVLYIYCSLAFMSIGRKAKLSAPGLAWIPSIGPSIISFQASKMHWWPWLLLIGFIIPFVNIIAILMFVIFGVVWRWKMFEAINRPGWWAIMGLIPVVGLVFIGIAAWGDAKKTKK